jgi:two-component system, response regulator RegA
MHGGRDRLMAILWVDDDKDLLRVIKRCVERTGRAVSTARNRDEATRVARSGEAFDVAVVDYCMPGDGGLEVIEAIRVHRPGARAVIYSGLVQQKAYDRARAANIPWFDKIHPLDLFSALEKDTHSPTLDSRQDQRRHYYVELVHRCGDNISEAERVTGFARSTFQRNLRPTWLSETLFAERHRQRTRLGSRRSGDCSANDLVENRVLDIGRVCSSVEVLTRSSSIRTAGYVI